MCPCHLYWQRSGLAGSERVVPRILAVMIQLTRQMRILVASELTCWTFLRIDPLLVSSKRLSTASSLATDHTLGMKYVNVSRS